MILFAQNVKQIGILWTLQMKRLAIVFVSHPVSYQTSAMGVLTVFNAMDMELALTKAIVYVKEHKPVTSVKFCVRDRMD